MNLRKIWLIYALLVLILLSQIHAQSINVGGIFPTIDHSGTVSKRLDYSLYYFAAFPLINFDKLNPKKYSTFHLFYSEQALSYNINSKFSLTGSYVYQRENVTNDNYINENRFYLQAKYKHTIKKVGLVHRLRFDGRFVQNRFKNQTPFTHRIRYLIGMDLPVHKEIYFTAYEEVFFNTFKNSNATYAENWAYLALGKKLNEKHKIEAGILYVTWNLGEQSWFNQYYFQLTWISHLNFRKKDNIK